MTKPKPKTTLSKATMRKLIELERRIHNGTPYRARPESGHAYVIGFDSGTVKVGSTANPDQRFRTLKRQAMQHGLRVVDARLSFEHAGYLDTEKQLIAFCRERCAGAPGREFFSIPFADVAEFAETFEPFDIAAFDEKVQRMGEHVARMDAHLQEVIAAAGGDLDVTYQDALAMLRAKQMAATST